MITVNDIYKYLKSIAPLEMANESDNVGFLVGTEASKVSKVLVSLDITDAVVSEALEMKAELIVAHHPMFFSLRTVTDADIVGKKIVRLLAGGISAICMHTNLDAANGGVNDALAVTVGISGKNRDAGPLSDVVRLATGEIVSLGRVGYLENACPIPEYLEKLKKALKVNGIRYYDAGRPVHKVAIASGSGGGEWENVVISGCDTFVSADLKYNIFLEAKEYGINIIDGGHFCTENVIVDVLVKKIKSEFPEINVYASKALDQTIEFY